MRHRNKFTALVCSLVLAATVGLGAYYNMSFWMYGNNDPASPWMGVGAYARGFADYWWAGHDGPTFVRVRIDGWTPSSCFSGWYEGSGWCADNAHNSGTGWYSEAQPLLSSIVPYGCFTSTAMFYVNGLLRSNYPIGECFSAPPPEQCDPGLDGTYQPGACVSPIVIATDKNRNYTLDRAGVLFDLDANGTLDRISWTKLDSDVAFLALDRNGNGKIDNGSELFGTATLPTASNGFEALRQLAGVNFGYVDAAHGGELFSKLLLWNDRNQNGVSEASELRQASDVLEAIGLGYGRHSRRDGAGNEYRYRSFARSKGTTAPESREFDIYDVYFANPR